MIPNVHVPCLLFPLPPHHSRNISQASILKDETSKTSESHNDDESATRTAINTGNDNIDNSIAKQALDGDDVPGPDDVICAKGSEGSKHEGNKYFRSLLRKYVQRYPQISSKGERTLIVSEIIDSMRRQRGTRFVKKNETTGDWVEVKDRLVTEMVSQYFRKLSKLSIHTNKSKFPSKKQLKAQITRQLTNKLHQIITENHKSTTSP